MRGLIQRLGRRRGEPLLVALDGVEIRSLHTLMAAAVFAGRALPLLWASYPEGERYNSQNNRQEGLRRLLRDLVAAHVAILVLADRGFGRAELARTCLGLPGLHFVLRLKPDVGVRHPRYRGLLSHYPVRPGIRRVLPQAAYRLSDPVTLHGVIRGRKALPADRKEPWFLITALPGNAASLTALYAQRMAVEELCGDDKSLRNGRALRLTQLTEARRLDGLLLIVALAYWLLVGLGLLARQKYRPALWCSTNGEKRGRPQCSALTIGRTVRDRWRERPASAFQAAAAATAGAAINCG